MAPTIKLKDNTLVTVRFSATSTSFSLDDKSVTIEIAPSLD